MTIESSKTLGGIGAILLFIGMLPFTSYLSILELIGIILVFVALYDLAKCYKENGIFSNAIYALAVGFIGAVTTVAAAFIMVLTSLTDFLHTIFPTWNGDWTTLQGLTPNTANINPSDIMPFVAGIIVVLLIVWLFAIAASFLMRRSLKQLSEKSNVGLFATAGLLLLIGAIIPLVGLIIIWTATLLLAMAFFKLKPNEPKITATTSYSTPPPTT